MYYEYFGLTKPPFRITPETGLFYSGAERGDILNALIYAVSNGDAITKVVGEVGAGKTMLCRMLELRLPDHIEIAYLPNPNIAPENILHAIAFEMGLPIASDKTANRLEVMKALEQYLLEKHGENHQVVVFVEEAQSMPLDTLEEIRLLSNLETQQHKLLQIVLFGQPELDDNLSAPHVRQIKERITNSFYLQPLRVNDIRNYLMFRLHLAGYNGSDLFSKFASSLIGLASRGLMRRINILADKAMLAAYSQDSQSVTYKHVGIAIRDSEFGRYLHWLQPATIAAALSVLVLGVASLAIAELSPRIEESLASESSSVSPSRIIVTQSEPLITSEVTSEVTSEFSSLSRSQISVSQNEPLETSDSVADLDSENPQAIASDELQIQLTPVEIIENRINQTVTWLEDQQPSHYSIQVLFANADSISGLEAFFAQETVRAEQDKLYIVQFTMEGKPILRVFYGDFSTFAEANSALKALPAVLTRYKPYLRRIGVVKAEASMNSTKTRS